MSQLVRGPPQESRETREIGVDDEQGLNILDENFARLIGLIWVSARLASEESKEVENEA